MVPLIGLTPEQTGRTGWQIVGQSIYPFVITVAHDVSPITDGLGCLLMCFLWSGIRTCLWRLCFETSCWQNGLCQVQESCQYPIPGNAFGRVHLPLPKSLKQKQRKGTGQRSVVRLGSCLLTTFFMVGCTAVIEHGVVTNCTHFTEQMVRMMTKSVPNCKERIARHCTANCDCLSFL